MTLLQKTQEMTEDTKRFIITKTEELEKYRASAEEVQEMAIKLSASKILTKEEQQQLAYVECYHKRQGEYNIIVVAPICKKFNCDSFEARQIRLCILLDMENVISKITDDDKAKILEAAHKHINSIRHFEDSDSKDCNHYFSVMHAREEIYHETLEEIKEKYELTKFRSFFELNILAICLLEEESEGIRLETA